MTRPLSSGSGHYMDLSPLSSDKKLTSIFYRLNVLLESLLIIIAVNSREQRGAANPKNTVVALSRIGRYTEDGRYNANNF